MPPDDPTIGCPAGEVALFGFVAFRERTRSRAPGCVVGPGADVGSSERTMGATFMLVLVTSRGAAGLSLTPRGCRRPVLSDSRESILVIGIRSLCTRAARSMWCRRRRNASRRHANATNAAGPASSEGAVASVVVSHDLLVGRMGTVQLV